MHARILFLFLMNVFFLLFLVLNADWNLNLNVLIRALIKSMGEILFVCGSNKSAVIATLSVIGQNIEDSEGSPKDEVCWIRANTDAPAAFILQFPLNFNLYEWVLFVAVFVHYNFTDYCKAYADHSKSAWRSFNWISFGFAKSVES